MGKVERGVDHALRALRGLRFEHPDAAKAYLDRWEERWADTRIHGTTKRQVAAMFAEEKPSSAARRAVSLLPSTARDCVPDGAVEVEGPTTTCPGWLSPPGGGAVDALHW
jgi:hypothetical protein